MTKFLESQTTKHGISLYVNEDFNNILPDKGAELVSNGYYMPAREVSYLLHKT